MPTQMDYSKGILSTEERAVCQEIAAGQAPWSHRAQALLSVDEGVSEESAGESAGLRATQVKYWLNRFQKMGMGIFPEPLLKAAYAAPSPAEASAPEETSESTEKVGKAKKSKKAKSKKGKGSKKKAKKSKKAKDSKKKAKKSKKDKGSKKKKAKAKKGKKKND